MEGTTITPEQDIFSERRYAWYNIILEWIESHWIIVVIAILVLILLGILSVWILAKKGIIDSIGPIKLGALKKNNNNKFKRRITDLPAPKPKNPEAELPSELKTLISELKAEQRKHILLQSNDQSKAEELGKLLYHKIEEGKVCDHIGWLHYEKAEIGQQVIEACIDQEFSIYKNENDATARRSKRLDFMSDSKRHTVLFVNIVKYRKDKDNALERYNNLKGLSMILMSKTEIQGFKTYLVTENGGELLCASKD